VVGGNGAAFSHPIVRAALYQELSPFARTQRHARAATVLQAGGRPADRVVAQLLRADAVGHGWAVDTLERAADEAAGRGAPEVAAALLERALHEPCDAERRSALLLALGSVELLARSAGALEHLREAFATAPNPGARAQAAVELGTALVFADRAQEAAELAHAVQPELGEPEREAAMQLEALALIATVGVVPVDRYGAEVLAAETPAARTLLGHVAFRRAAAGEPAEVVVPLARRSLESGRLALGAGNDPVFTPVFVLLFDDRIDEAVALVDDLMRAAQERGSLMWFASASAIRADAHYRAGALVDAEADAEQALETAAAGLRFWELEVAVSLIRALVDAGRGREASGVLERAADSVSATSPVYQHGYLAYVRGVAAASAGRLEEAAAAFLTTGDRMLELGSGNPAVLDWRSRAALALARLGDRERAIGLAAEEVELARAFGAARAMGMALRAHALVHDHVLVDELAEAVEVLGASPARLEHARALVDYGAALRRDGHRAAAREPLLEGLDASTRCGAHALVARAREELLAAGARPRHVLRRGVDALTASERRVALMAVDGLSNPEIAQALFVTTRTVEAHLSHAYRKLDVTGRDELAPLFAADRPEPSEAR
jgi:DNA-binding CsgD family transcriptional regulator